MRELKQFSLGETNKQVTKTDGCWVNYGEQKHLDIQCGNSAYVLGYNDKDILNAMRHQDVNFLRGNAGESSLLNDQLIDYICEKGNWSAVAWAVSGSDAVEAAIAMNDCYWQHSGYYNVKTKILSFTPGYHGTTMLAKHLRGDYPYLNRAEIINNPSWQNISDREQAEEQSLNAVKHKLENTPNIGCIIMETMPWISNITPYSQNWWIRIRQLCDEYNILMIVDDVALCWGKTGTMFGWQNTTVQPDISALGKSLTAGYSPLGAAVCNEKVNSVLSQHSWDHGHTWSPNMQGVAAAIVASKKIENLLVNVSNIEKELQLIGQELQLNTRGEGLFVCFDTPKPITLADLSSVGLAASIPGFNCIKVVAPIIADSYYFETLKTRLKKLK